MHGYWVVLQAAKIKVEKHQESVRVIEALRWAGSVSDARRRAESVSGWTTHRGLATKQTGHFRPTLRAARLSAFLGGAASSAYHLRQIRTRRRCLMKAKIRTVADLLLPGQTPRFS